MNTWTITGSINKTHWINATPPCPFCDGRNRSTLEFHGHWATFCDHCGEELA